MTVWSAGPTLPTRRDEAWRYTPLERVLAVPYESAPRPRLTPELAHDVRRLLDTTAPTLGGVRLVVVNGALEPDLSVLDSVPDGVTSTAGPTAATDGDGAAEGFEALNRIGAPETVTIAVAAGVDAGLIDVVHVSLPHLEPVAVHPRTFVVLGEGSVATVAETYLSRPGDVLVNASTTATLADRAALTHILVQAEGADSVHLGRSAFDLGSDSRLRSTVVSAGGAVARAAIDVRFSGDGAHAELDGLYATGGSQHHDHVVTVDHAASGCTSNQLYKGVLDDHGHGCFTGHVIVRPGTVRTDARQSNRTLLLTSTAQSDARPWLEILADDVKASHGATVGRLDDDALFYLRSRGIPEATARELLIDAFVGEIVDGVEVAPLRDRIRTLTTGAPR